MRQIRKQHVRAGNAKSQVNLKWGFFVAYIFRRHDQNGKPIGSWFLGYEEGGKPRQVTLRTRKKSMAERALARFRLELDCARAGLPAPVTVAEAEAAFLESRGGLRPASVSWYRKRLGLWTRTLPAGTLLRSISPADLDGYKTARGRMVSASTVEQDMRCLAIFLGWCTDVRAWLPASPMSRPIRRVIGKPEPDRLSLTRKQIAEWTRALAGDRLLDVFLVAVHTGMRLQELIFLERGDIGKVIRVRRKPWMGFMIKTHEERDVAIAPALRPVIRRMPATGPALPSPGGGRWGVDEMEGYWRRMRKRLKLPPVRPHRKTGKPVYGVSLHELRHTFATLHVDRGTPVSILADALGHKRLSTTDRYYSPQRRRRDLLEMARAE